MTARPAALLARLFQGSVLCLLLAGCSSLSDDKKKSPPAPVRLEVAAPRELRDLLETHLDLARLDTIAPGSALDETELARLVASTPEQARELLKTEGYFSPQVAVERAEGTPPVVRVRVQPGPRVLVRGLKIEFTGPLAEAGAQDEPHAREAEKSVRQNWPLPPGAPFRNPLWSSGKRDALAQLRAQAYLDAQLDDSAAQVDADRQAADLSLRANSGPLYRTGPLRIRGLKAHDEETVRNIANFDPGSIATETLLLDFQERLQNTNLFDRATVTVRPNAADPAAAQVDVRLRERKLQDATFGVGVSADVGARGRR